MSAELVSTAAAAATAAAGASPISGLIQGLGSLANAAGTFYNGLEDRKLRVQLQGEEHLERRQLQEASQEFQRELQEQAFHHQGQLLDQQSELDRTNHKYRVLLE